MLLTILRTFSLFAFSLFCFRIMGFRSLGDMEPFDFVIVLAIAEILGSPLADHSINPLYAFTAIATLTIAQLALSYFALKNKFFRIILEGKPLPVIQDGKVIMENLKSSRFSIDDLNEELRVHGVDAITDVKTAYLEPSGRFSVILNKESAPVTARFLKMPVSYNLVDNGSIDFEELKKAGLSVHDLENRLRVSGISNLIKVKSATLDNQGNFIVQVSIDKD